MDSSEFESTQIFDEEEDNVSKLQWITVGKKDENGKDIHTPTLHARKNTISYMLFHSGMFQFSTISKNRTKCVVECSFCPKEKKKCLCDLAATPI